ncbi:hypothetical protein [Rossellomorea marisflavi]|uniref:hypothetical protein n=1 Tax=Rossellomorea marisflavi TaxID=189381 RepID=UPI003457CCC1
MSKQYPKEKEEKNNSNGIKKEEIETIFPIIIVYIGISLMFLGILTVYTEVPKEFLIGASLSGMFFAIADFIILKSKISHKDVLITKCILFLGVASFFLLPVIMIVSPDLSERIGHYGNFASLLALGIVVSSLGYRSLASNRKYILEMVDDMRELKVQRDKIQTEIDEFKREHLKMKDETMKKGKEIEEMKGKINLAEEKLKEKKSSSQEG